MALRDLLTTQLNGRKVLSETIVVRRIGKSDVRITGKVLATVRQRFQQRPEGDLWDRLTLLELADSSWVTITQRVAPNLTELVGEYKRIMRPKVVPAGGMIGIDGEADTAEDADYRMIRATMGALGWSVLAKHLAQQMSWPVTDDLDI